MTEIDTRFMKMALALGARGLGRVWPNPAVGCVVVRDGVIVGRGWTQAGGRPHAETVALAQAGDKARGATAYVTLEPCAHHGQTPPCADALISAGVARVVVAVTDPDPRVNGGGIARLKAAGVDVVSGICAEAAHQANAGFFLRVSQGRPFVTLKLAASLDGRIATATGESKWITGPDARRLVHAMRANHDAVMVGAGTARADDPSLTVRGLGVDHQPVRVVVSRRLDIPVSGVLAKTAKQTPVWVLHGADADGQRVKDWRALGARSLPCAIGSDRQVDPAAALAALGEAGITRVFCEGGGALAASLIGQGLVDELLMFNAGLTIGAEGQPMLGAMGLDALSEARGFELIEHRTVGADVMTRWRGA
ncbi:MAG: bifunctional diaminohydroxyphosphoribosylaminopyrimidine deaminase/5-amino-6-(5-phosphoribosylamino)uracil reductase RibD [Marinosulfonomonas sp.]